MRGAFELLFFSAHGGFQFPRRLSHSAKTPPFPRAAQLAHPRGAPYSASLNTAGGGEAAAPMRPSAFADGRAPRSFPKAALAKVGYGAKGLIAALLLHFASPHAKSPSGIAISAKKCYNTVYSIAIREEKPCQISQKPQ